LEGEGCDREADRFFGDSEERGYEDEDDVVVADLLGERVGDRAFESISDIEPDNRLLRLEGDDGGDLRGEASEPS
jgi:hypothetical protein